jgi:hypothetical protein
MINSDFQSYDEAEYASVEAALDAQVKAAAAVATEAVTKGESNVAIEIQVEQDGKILGRRVLSMSVSDLIPND